MTAVLRRFAPSFFAQVFGLIVLSLVAAQGVNMAILYFLPPPPPEFFRASEVARALRAAGGPVATGAGRTLRAVVTPEFKAIGQPRAQRFAERLREELALQLRVGESRVHLTLLDTSVAPSQRPKGSLPGSAARDGPWARPGSAAAPCLRF